MTNELKIIERIKANYMQKETTQFDELKELDKKVKLPARIFAYVFGTVSSLILGTGMCLAMKVIGASLSGAMPLGICIGLIGILLVSLNYPLYKSILGARKNKYSKRIIELSNSLLNK